MPTGEKSSMGIVSVRYFEFPSAVDGVGFKTVQSLDFRIARTAAEILLGDSPKRVATNHGVDAVFLAKDMQIYEL